MDVFRNFFLSCSQSQWLRERATRYRFVRRAVSRFMPGETAADALSAAVELQERLIGTVFTHLGENISDTAEAASVTSHYIEVLDLIRKMNLNSEVAVKLTQLGLDLSSELCYSNLEKIIVHAGDSNLVWIDMEASNYVDVTLDLARRARSAHPNVGVCVQAYLYRTAKDLASLIRLGMAIRLVKGAYKEPADLAFPQKRDVDENYYTLGKQLLGEDARRSGVRAAFATHDLRLIRRIIEHAAGRHLDQSAFEFQMLYGIQRDEQYRLARDGWKSIVLVAYGSYWFPWYMRRLAERPANAWFVVRNLFAT